MPGTGTRPVLLGRPRLDPRRPGAGRGTSSMGFCPPLLGPPARPHPREPSPSPASGVRAGPGTMSWLLPPGLGPLPHQTRRAHPPCASEADSCGFWEDVLGTELQGVDDNSGLPLAVLPPSAPPGVLPQLSAQLGCSPQPPRQPAVNPWRTLQARSQRVARWAVGHGDCGLCAGPGSQDPSLPHVPPESPLFPRPLHHGHQAGQGPRPLRRPAVPRPRSPHLERAGAADTLAD